MNRYKFFLKEIKLLKLKLVIILFLTTSITIISLIFPYINKIIVDEIIINGNNKLIFYILSISVSLFLLSSYIEIHNNYLFWFVINKITYKFKILYLKIIINSNINLFFKLKPGEIISRIQNEVQDISNLINIIKTLYIEILNIIFILAIIIKINLNFGFYSLIGVPLVFLITKILNPELRRKNNDVLVLYSKLNNIIQDTMNGIYIIKSIRISKYPLLKFSKEYRNYIKSSFEIFKLQTISSFILSFIYFSLNMLLIFLGAFYVKKNIISVGDIVAIISYINILFSNTNNLTSTIYTCQKTIVSINRFDEIYDKGFELLPSTKIKSNEIKKIRFDNVTLTYYPDKKVLKNFSYHFCFGKIIFIIGPNSAGKTTIINLILGLIRPQEGNIFYDDINLEYLTKSSFRNILGYVPQEIWLFNDSVYNNIYLGRPSSNEMALVELLNILDLKLDLNTLIEKNGANISGGQKQKIAIIRALVLDPPLIILDESFSNLDNNTKEELFKYLSKVKNHKIIIVVTHEKEFLKYADEILDI